MEIYKALGVKRDDAKRDVLLKALKKEDRFDVKPAVVYALGEYKDKKILETLVYELEDPNEEVQIALLNVLERWGEKTAAAYVLYFFETLYAREREQELTVGKEVKLAALKALEKLGNKKIAGGLASLAVNEKNELIKKKITEVTEALKKK